MKRKLLSVLLATVLLLTCIPLGAVSAEEYEGDYEYTVSDGKATITGYTGSGGTITIPSTLGGYPVTTIGENAFHWCESLISVTIPDSVTTIGEKAFHWCESLTSVTIGDSVTTIGDWAFLGCTNLTSVTIPDSVTTIVISAFWECTSLTAIEVDENNVNYCSVDGVLFNKDKTTIVQYPGGKEGAYSIPDSVTTIGSYAFYWCTSLTSVTIPDSVTTIGDWAFWVCTNLTSVTIPDSVISIGQSAFYDCDSLTSVTIGDSVTTIGNEAFYDCTSLTSVTIPDSVTTIGWYAFYNCTSLTSVIIPDSVTAIGYGAFRHCTSLTSVTIPDSVTTIGEDAFRDCNRLTAIEVDENNVNYCSADGVLFNKDKTTLVQYPGGKSGAYSILNSVTTIGNSAFSDCTSLTSVFIPDSVTSIGSYAFLNCESLTSVTILDSVTTIDTSAFAYCTSLTTVTIPDSVTTIGRSAFSVCTSLTDVYYGGSETDKANITISSSGNTNLTDATWHYNCVNPKDLYAANIVHSVMDTEKGNGLAFRFELTASVGIKGTNKADLTDATINYLGQTCKLVGMGSVISNQEGATLELSNVNGKTVIDVPTVYLTDWEPDSCTFATRIINIPDSALERTIYARPYYIVEVEGEQIAVYGDVDSASCAEYM